MSDNIIQIDQTKNIAKEYVKRFDLEIQGYSQDKSKQKETITIDDNTIKLEQAENIWKQYMKRFDLEVQGYTQDKSRQKETITIDERGYQRFGGADVVFGSIGYTHPVTDRLNATIRASGVYVHGKDFKVMMPTYVGGSLEYSF